MGTTRRLGSALIGLLHTRAELFKVELQEEKLRAIRFVVWVCAAVAIGAGGILVAVGGLALFLWEVAGYWGLIGLAAGAIGMAALILWIAYQRMTHGPAPFEATVAEFRKDAECLRKRE
ncbi:MAG TPA: phage holin family protein [Terriglobales bacterium]|jgi:uncharacterized membrane protein YqjE|nr:phage holin family protein [Terriglobales bacterium]